MQRPKIAITMGDVAGIGPEVIARACSDSRLCGWCRPVIVGDPVVLERAFAMCGVASRVRTIKDLADFGDAPDVLDCWNPSPIDVQNVPLGRNDARAGGAAYDWLVAAARAALAGKVDAVTTAPISKAALHLAGRLYPGHTEILAEVCGVTSFAMMLFLPQGPKVRSPHGLGVAHVTLHTSIASVPKLLSTKTIGNTIGLIADFLPRVGCGQPRIGVCALNPHAGEDGLFGDEEQRLIAPAVHAAVHAGINAAGPLPADVLMRRAIAGEFDGVAAMYHDQGHIAVKLVAFDSAVNVTLGLPIVRTSPSHGTAFDIAGKGLARADGLREAVRVASLLTATR